MWQERHGSITVPFILRKSASFCFNHLLASSFPRFTYTHSHPLALVRDTLHSATTALGECSRVWAETCMRRDLVGVSRRCVMWLRPSMCKEHMKARSVLSPLSH